jgi:hypothetical protein|tara:strand:- start:310 stop:531 length:222 start_codon:yes stop_codon:yes gene_type:complete
MEIRSDCLFGGGKIGLSKLECLNDRHGGWDILAANIVGIGSTYLFTTPYMAEHFELSFKSGQNTYAMGMVYKF